MSVFFHEKKRLKITTDIVSKMATFKSKRDEHDRNVGKVPPDERETFVEFAETELKRFRTFEISGNALIKLLGEKMETLSEHTTDQEFHVDIRYPHDSVEQTKRELAAIADDDGDSRSGLHKRGSPPTSPSYSPTSPSYGPTSP